MGGLLQIWQALDLRRRILLAGAVAATLAGVIAIGAMAARPSMALLYSGLDLAAAGEVVGALDGMGVPYRVEGSAIYVEAGARDRARLALAGEGLPRQGQEGYELLDRLSGFSATSEMFSAAYWRAKEGELARTLLASPRVRAARVHIATPVSRAFRRDAEAASATVTLTMAGGAATVEEATAFRYLVALSVPDLAPEAVAVIDSRAGLVLAPGDDRPVAAAAGRIADREAHLKGEIEDLLAARVGRGNARVSVAIEMDRTEELVSEKVLEPDSRVQIHTDTQEMSDTSKGGGGAVTVASNLPEDDEGGSGSERESARSETRERVNYEYNEVRRERRREAGAIGRISVAVLVDGIVETDAAGERQWQPRDPAELEALRQLVIAAVGFDEERGDVVTIESMAFQPPPDEGTAAEPGLATRLLEEHALSLVQLGVLAALVLVIALTVLRPMLATPAEAAPLPAPAAEPAGSIAGPDGEDAGAEPVAGDADPIYSLPDRETLRRAVAERQTESLSTLRDWLDGADEEEEAA